MNALQQAWAAINASARRIGAMRDVLDQTKAGTTLNGLSRQRELLALMEQLYTLREERLEHLIGLAWDEAAAAQATDTQS